MYIYLYIKQNSLGYYITYCIHLQNDISAHIEYIVLYSHADVWARNDWRL